MRPRPVQPRRLQACPPRAAPFSLASNWSTATTSGPSPRLAPLAATTPTEGSLDHHNVRPVSERQSTAQGLLTCGGAAPRYLRPVTNAAKTVRPEGVNVHNMRHSSATALLENDSPEGRRRPPGALGHPCADRGLRPPNFPGGRSRECQSSVGLLHPLLPFRPERPL